LPVAKAKPPSLREIKSIREPILTVEFAGRCHGMGKTQSYDSVRAGTFPVEVIRRGRHIYVSTMALWRSLGIEPDSGRRAG
jgi:hypothetical protein